MPDLYSLLKQFNAIGGMAQTGQSGFCLLMALWQKANELNWTDRFTMTNAEVLYKAGFNCQKTLIETRNKLCQMGFFKYIKPSNRKKCGVYIMNYDLLKLTLYLPDVNSNVNNEHAYLPDVNSGVNSDVNSGVNSDVNSGVNSDVNSGVNINKLNQTKPTEKEKEKEKKEKESLAALPPNGGDAVSKIMDFYNKTFEGLWQRPLKLTSDREAKIKARLKKFTVEEICAAIKNVRASPFHCGENDKKIVYATPEFICRNDSQIDKWLNMKKRNPLDWMERV